MPFIISFLIIFRLSFKGKNISIGWRQNQHSYVGDFNPGLITVPLIIEKGHSFLMGFLITLPDMPFMFFYHFISHQLPSNVKLSLALECTSARMPFKFSLLIKSMVLWSSVKSGSRLRMHRQKFDSLFAVWYCRWVCGAYTTKKQLLIQMSPLSHQFLHQIFISTYHFRIGLVKSSTYFYFEEIYLLYLFSFSFASLAVTGMSLLFQIVKLQICFCVLCILYEDRLYFLISTTVTITATFLSAIPTNLYIFWYIQYTKYKITIIIKTIETQILKCVLPSQFGG